MKTQTVGGSYYNPTVVDSFNWELALVVAVGGIFFAAVFEALSHIAAAIEESNPKNQLL